MKFIDVKSAIIGVLITLLFLSIYGFRPETDELGHLVVKSITVEDDRGVVMGYMGNGYMQTYNTFGEPTLFVGTCSNKQCWFAKSVVCLHIAIAHIAHNYPAVIFNRDAFYN